MAILLIIFTIILSIITLKTFYTYLVKGKINTNKEIWRFIQIWTVFVCPAHYLILLDLVNKNQCCPDSAVFSPEHRIGIYSLILLYTVAYAISIYRKKILPPIAEFLINVFLILGLFLNMIFFKHFIDPDLGYIWPLVGNIPIVLLLLIELSENEKKLTIALDENNFNTNSYLGKLCSAVLNFKFVQKYTVLSLILAPFLILLSLFLLLFGQKPDSLIRAFTETYQHGFSQLDYLCDNVGCGGHFLCSVGANGHNAFVKPLRYGERHGNKIICNRQLLISNAFEDLIQSKFPIIHKIIRQQYNKVGNKIHRYYFIFNNKYISDLVYILMKPLELTFLLILYTFDHAPENRIAKQYLNENDRVKIDEILEGN